MKRIDINCDMGEIPEMVDDGSQEALMPYVTSVNIACGGHAGDQRIMRTTTLQAQRWNLNVSAHPGYPDRVNFGRSPLEMPPSAIADFVFEQIRTLAQIAQDCSATIRHMKPHGALYNSAVKNPEIAEAIAQGAARWSKDLVLVGLAGSPMLDIFRAAGFSVLAEAFADRRYEPDGSLRSRHHADSLITDPQAAARQVHDIVNHRFVIAVDGSKIPIDAQTLCIHSDTPGALDIGREVARQLR